MPIFFYIRSNRLHLPSWCQSPSSTPLPSGSFLCILSSRLSTRAMRSRQPFVSCGWFSRQLVSQSFSLPIIPFYQLSACGREVAPILKNSKTFNTFLFFRHLCINFVVWKQCPGSAAGVTRWCERKVRAAQGTPLPKIEAAGDGRKRRRKQPPCFGEVRVRRWCKRPPAGGWSSGCAIWGLQVHVYHRSRAARPRASGSRWRVECWSRGATYGVDKWQAPHLPRGSCGTEPGL